VFVLQAGVLVTLGGCHLLDGLVDCGSVEARKEIVRGSEEGLRTMCGSRTGGWSLPCVMSD
jgi:hypothetical protein